MTKIAVLHWHTSSVGGIATTLFNYKKVAEKYGDTFHVFACDNQRTKKPVLLEAPKRVRGGDSFIDIDGYMPHHASNYKDSAAYLSKNYDVIMTSFLCPHPTKDYGSEPVFMNLLKSLSDDYRMPIIGYIHDAYWDTYKVFGELVLPLCDKVMVCQKAYGEPLLAAGVEVEIAHPPFFPLPVKREVKIPNSVIWLPQWKNIKGVHAFFKGVPELTGHKFSVDMFNNGIEYYKLRLTPEWKKVVGQDKFAPDYSGKGRAVFHGSRPLAEVAQALNKAEFSCDFQGSKSKFAAYTNGSYSHTLAESMYYGACPVVHSNLLKSGLPDKFVIAVDRLEDYPTAIGYYAKNAKYPKKAAREYVMDHFDAERQYAKIFSSY